MRDEDKKHTTVAEVPAELPMEKALRIQEELDRVAKENPTSNDVGE